MEGEEAQNPPKSNTATLSFRQKHVRLRVLSALRLIATSRYYSLTRVLFATIGARHSGYRQADGPRHARKHSSIILQDTAGRIEYKLVGQRSTETYPAVCPSAPLLLRRPEGCQDALRATFDGASARKTNATTGTKPRLQYKTPQEMVGFPRMVGIPRCIDVWRDSTGAFHSPPP